MRRIFHTGIATLSFGVLALNGVAQCKKFIGDRAPLEYRSRGTLAIEKRCEGFMKKDIAGLDGEIVSVTRGRPSYYSTAEEVIFITAPSVSDTQPLECTGVARNEGAYYRLDLELAPGETRHIPVKDVLLAGNIRNDQLGVTLRRAGTTETYIPVTVSSQLRKGAVGAPDSVFIKFMPRILLRDLGVEVYDPSTKGKVYGFIAKGRFQADQDISIGIPVSSVPLEPGQERYMVVMLKSKADDGGPRLDRSFTVLFQ